MPNNRLYAFLLGYIGTTPCATSQRHEVEYAKYMQYLESWQSRFQDVASLAHEGNTDFMTQRHALLPPTYCSGRMLYVYDDDALVMPTSSSAG